MSRTTALCVAVALGIGASLSAQSLIRGIGTVREMPNGFRFDEIAMPLSAPGVDLRQFVGHVAEVTGTLQNGDETTFAVATIAPASSWFTCSGDTKVGNDVQFRIDVPDVGRWYLYAAFDAGATPLESYMPYGSGTLWLHPASLMTLGLGPMFRTWQDRLRVPNAPELVGISVWFQGAVHIEPGPLLFLNAARITLLP